MIAQGVSLAKVHVHACYMYVCFVYQKLRQIDQLKQQQAEGNQLELNQVLFEEYSFSLLRCTVW